MSYGESYTSALNRHRQSLTDLEHVLKELDVDALADENQRLVEEVDRLSNEIKKQKEFTQKLEKDLSITREAYRDQILNEKLGHIRNSKKRMLQLFENQAAGNVNRLSQIEQGIRVRINKFLQNAAGIQNSVGQKYYDEMMQLQLNFDADLKAIREKIEKEHQRLRDQVDGEYNQPELGSVDPETLKKIRGQNNFEIKLGLNMVNKLGIVLIFLAVILAGRYTYQNWFGSYAKGIAFYCLGIASLVSGEWLYKRKMTTVAAGLIGGGIGLFYASTFICTFYLHILSFNAAMGVSGIIAVASLILTLRYRSQTIGLMSLIGGYLPFFAYVVMEGITEFSAMQALAYLMLFNGVVLGISVKHKWNLIIYVGFLFNMPCVHSLLWLMSGNILPIFIAYLNFVIYLAVVLYRNVKEKLPLTTPDIILTGMNTLVNCMIVYALFVRAGYKDYDGILAIGYALIYLTLGKVIERMQGQKNMVHIFYSFAVGFSILVIPLQLTAEWVFFGWLIEAVIYVYLGRANRIRPLEMMGNGLAIAGHLAFFVLYAEKLGFYRAYPTWVDAKYLAVILSEIGIAWIYGYFKKQRPEEKMSDAAIMIRYPILAHINVFMIYQGLMIYRKATADVGTVFIEGMALSWGITVLFNYLLASQTFVQKVRFDWYRRITELIVYGLLIFINLIPIETMHLRYFIDVALLILCNGMIIWRMNRFMIELHDWKGFSREWRAVVLAVYALCAYFVNLGMNYRLQNLGVVLNVSLIVFALIYIGLGFKERFTFLRRIGLGLSLAATAKMLIIDSLTFSIGQRIFSYFVFGIILIAISIVYQRISARLLGDEKVG